MLSVVEGLYTSWVMYLPGEECIHSMAWMSERNRTVVHSESMAESSFACFVMMNSHTFFLPAAQDDSLNAAYSLSQYLCVAASSVQ